MDLGIPGLIKAAISFFEKLIYIGIPKTFHYFFGKKTIVLINDVAAPHENFWHIGAVGNKPALQIGCSFMVTNITDHPVALAKAIWKGKIKGTVEYMKVSIKDPNSQYGGSYDIPPHARTRVSVDFFIIPVEMPKKDDVITLSIGIIDQFGKKHWIKNVDFRSS